MNREVPDDVNVFLVEAQIHPRETHVTQSAQGTAIDQFLYFDYRGAVDECVAGHQSSPGEVPNSGQLSRLLTAVSERLFHEHVLATHESTFCQVIMGTDVGCDEYRINVGFQ